jgi:hypothetical protein
MTTRYLANSVTPLGWSTFFEPTSSDSLASDHIPTRRSFQPLTIIFDNPSVTQVRTEHSIQIAVSQTIPVIKAPSENAILARLPPIQRWAYIARNHPIDFSVSVGTFVAAVYILIHGVSGVVQNISGMLIPAAFAQWKADVPIFGSFAFDIRMVVIIVMAIALVWSYGLASWAKAEAKIGLAKDSIRFLQGFFAGIITGLPK